LGVFRQLRVLRLSDESSKQGKLIMAAKQRRIMSACISITPLFLVMSPLAEQITGMEISIDPRATYLRTNLDSGALAATHIDLNTPSVLPGDGLRLERLGDFDCGGPCVDDRTAMIGVFSGRSTLLSAEQLHRVPDAIEAGQDFTTNSTHFGSLPTNIPEDFQITDTIVVTPVGATHLFIAAHDSLYQDNSDPDGDFAVRITVLAERPGDYNDDGVVNAADYVVWRDNEGTTNTLANDPIGGKIGPAHYDQWRARFGQTASNGAGADVNAPVPEPTSILLMALAAAWWLCEAGPDRKSQQLINA
jgi:hypothetical protein